LWCAVVCVVGCVLPFFCLLLLLLWLLVGSIPP
jgi:hypothetical protein